MKIVFFWLCEKFLILILTTSFSQQCQDIDSLLIWNPHHSTESMCYYTVGCLYFMMQGYKHLYVHNRYPELKYYLVKMEDRQRQIDLQAPQMPPPTGFNAARELLRENKESVIIVAGVTLITVIGTLFVKTARYLGFRWPSVFYLFRFSNGILKANKPPHPH